MLKNNFKTALRSLLKNRVYSFINIFGLAIGIAGALFIGHYVAFESSYEDFIKNASNKYRVSLEYKLNGEDVYHSAENYPPVGPTMTNDFPEVLGWAHAYNMGAKNNVVITYEEGSGEPKRLKHKRFLYASASFLDMFSAEMLLGDTKTALQQPFTIVISESTAKKYFGNEDPMGKYLRLKDDDFNNENCLVTGVFKDIPSNSHLPYDVLISTATLYGRFDGALTRYKDGWIRKDFYSYIEVKPGTDMASLQAKLPGMINKYMPGLADRNAEHIMHLQPIRDIHLYSHLADEARQNGDGDAIIFLTIIAVFIMILAWVNYVNLATARSLDRAKEVGVRKVLGSRRRQLINQFLMESFTINGLALLIAYGVILLFLPKFHQVSGIPADQNIWSNVYFWFASMVILIIGALLSGLYPAFVLSSFKPVATLKGKFRNSHSGILLRKGLVIFQFAISAALIIGTLVVRGQMNFMKNADLGFDKEQVLVVERAAIADTSQGGRNRQITTFLDQLTQKPGVIQATSSGIVPGKKLRFQVDTRNYYKPQGDTYPLQFAGGDYDLIETLGMEVIAGRNFSRDFPRDLDSALLVTRSAVSALGFESPEDIINKTLMLETFDASGIVIGVVEDYNHESLKVKPAPTVLVLNRFWAEYFLIRIDANQVNSAIQDVESAWHTVFAGNPFDFFFLDQFFDNQYRAEEQFQSLFSIFSVLAILIGCLGLFGLSSFSAMQRRKEIGVRKVLGASVKSILFLQSKEYMMIIGLANLLAWPIIYFSMKTWLQSFDNRIVIDWVLFVYTLIIVTLTAIATISYQTIKSARINPAGTLRSE